MTTASTAAARPSTHRGTMIAAGLALMVPLAFTVVMMLAEATAPDSLAGTYALIAVEHLVPLVGAVVLFTVGRRVGRPFRGLGLTAVVAAVVLIAVQLVVQASDSNIGGGALWLVAAGVLAVVGGVTMAASRRA